MTLINNRKCVRYCLPFEANMTIDILNCRYPIYKDKYNLPAFSVSTTEPGRCNLQIKLSYLGTGTYLFIIVKKLNYTLHNVFLTQKLFINNLCVKFQILTKLPMNRTTYHWPKIVGLGKEPEVPSVHKYFRILQVGEGRVYCHVQKFIVLTLIEKIKIKDGFCVKNRYQLGRFKFFKILILTESLSRDSHFFT